MTGLVSSEELRKAGAGFRVLQHIWVRGLGLLRAHRASVTLPECLCAFCMHRHCMFSCAIYVLPVNETRRLQCVRHNMKARSLRKAVSTLRKAAFIWAVDAVLATPSRL